MSTKRAVPALNRSVPNAERPPGFEDAIDGLYLAAYQVAYRILGSRPDAEEVAQEAVARACPRWAKVGPYARAWVCRVAANLAISAYRRRRLPPPVPAPAFSEDSWAARLDLVSALGHLSRRQRQVVVLRYLADLPEAEVATALGCSAGTVKAHASRGLAALRGALSPDTDPSEA